MYCKRLLIVGALVFGLATVATADVIPSNAESNILAGSIQRPGLDYHDGDVIEYTVAVGVPAQGGNDGNTCRQENVVVQVTLPNGVVITFATIPIIDPGDGFVFDSADDSRMAYTIAHADEVNGRVTATLDAVSEIAHVTEDDEDNATLMRDIGAVVLHIIPCRFTGGGVGTDTTTFEEGEMVWENGVGTDRAQFGGQAGANTALPPQPAGEWTHHQQRGISGKFTFHGGTSSAPDGTEIIEIRCRDAGGCAPGDPPSPAKQLDFDGIGTFKSIGKGNNVPEWEIEEPELNVTAEGKGNKTFDGTFHWFEVNIDDLGEPGNKGTSTDCPPLGFGEKGTGGDADCGCPDFYRITIYDGARRGDVVWENGSIDPSSLPRLPGDVIYEFYAYIDGGNLQIHRLTGFDTK
jgi:hypothetical protein